MIALGILGAVIASFVTVVSERLHTGQSWVQGRSRCNSCNIELAPGDLVPVVSWLNTLGRCRACKARVPGSYALTETILALLFMVSYLALGFSLALFVFLIALSVLAFVVLYDLRHTVVPMESALLLILVSLAFAYLSSEDLVSFGLALLVSGAIALGFFLLYALSRGRAMGLGDAPVALALALSVGPGLAFAGLLFSFWIGAIVGIAILVRHPKGHRMGIEVPFVPFLAAGYLLAFFTQWNPLALTF